MARKPSSRKPKKRARRAPRSPPVRRADVEGMVFRALARAYPAEMAQSLLGLKEKPVVEPLPTTFHIVSDEELAKTELGRHAAAKATAENVVQVLEARFGPGGAILRELILDVRDPARLVRLLRLAATVPTLADFRPKSYPDAAGFTRPR